MALLCATLTSTIFLKKSVQKYKIKKFINLSKFSIFKKKFISLVIIISLFSSVETIKLQFEYFIFFVDVTPTGSLRRRRSRVPSEEEESTLMDFLRSAEQESAKERKSWGSLGIVMTFSFDFQH